MKTGITSGILLLILTAYLVIPVIPVFDYIIHKDYIAKNLCVNRDKPKSSCNGKCHMVKKLQETNPNPQNESKNTNTKVQLKDLDVYILDIPDINSIAIFNAKQLIYNLFNFEQLASSAIFVPPKPAFRTV